jgi:hypothetical protein
MNDQPSNVSNINNTYMQCIPKMNISKLLTKYDININDSCENKDENESCGICNDTMVEGNDIHILKCKHKYHLSCITKWFISFNKSSTHSNAPNKRECPYCRKDGGWIPLLQGQAPIYNVHAEYVKEKPKKTKNNSANVTTNPPYPIVPGTINNNDITIHPLTSFCKAITGTGNKCKNTAKFGSYCGIASHKKQGIVLDNISINTDATDATN